MFKQILVPVDLADTELAKPSSRDGSLGFVRVSGGGVRICSTCCR